MEISRDFRELAFQLVLLYYNITSRQNYLVFLAKGAEPEIPRRSVHINVNYTHTIVLRFFPVLCTEIV